VKDAGTVDHDHSKERSDFFAGQDKGGKRTLSKGRRIPRRARKKESVYYYLKMSARGRVLEGGEKNPLWISQKERNAVSGSQGRNPAKSSLGKAQEEKDFRQGRGGKESERKKKRESRGTGRKHRRQKEREKGVPGEERERKKSASTSDERGRARSRTKGKRFWGKEAVSGRGVKTKEGKIPEWSPYGN